MLAAALGHVSFDGTNSSASSAREAHGEGGGFLSATSAEGGVSLAAPRARLWQGTFGGLVLCARSAGDRVELQRVRVEEDVHPLGIRHLIRMLPESTARPGRAVADPVYSSKGPAERLDVRGATLRPVRGTVIDQPCAEARHEERRFTELLTELTVDRRGGGIRTTYLDYAAAGRPYTLVIPWRMIACGSRTPARYCHQTR